MRGSKLTYIVAVFLIVELAAADGMCWWRGRRGIFLLVICSGVSVSDVFDEHVAPRTEGQGYGYDVPHLLGGMVAVRKVGGECGGICSECMRGYVQSGLHKLSDRRFVGEED